MTRPLPIALHGTQNVFQRVRRMGIVDQNSIIRPGCRDDLDPALDQMRLPQCRRDFLQRQPQLQGDGNDRHRIVDGKAAGDRQRHRRPLPVQDRVKRDMVGVQTDILRLQRRGLCTAVVQTGQAAWACIRGA